MAALGQFTEQLKAEGFGEIVTVERAPNEALDEHVHPFEAKALILEGHISISIAGKEAVFKPGEVFHLPANTPHAECYGPTGVRYLVGKKQ